MKVRKVIRRDLHHSGDGIDVDSRLHAVIAANVADKQRGARMTDRDRTPEMTSEELQAETAEELPDREAMSLINANVAAPVNAAVALNALSDDSVAIANAEQDVVIDQSN